LWKVDDVATALLMKRFYENLLGRRAGLPGPMGRAAALAEAKKWLRELTSGQIKTLAESLGGGTWRVSVSPLKPLVKSPPKDERPFAHPHYWSAFILLGDPDW
jgi:CHAT domain-containing protein